MNPKYPQKMYTIEFDADRKLFTLWNAEGLLVGEDVNGRELGREAWISGADIVCYNYNLTLDEEMPLKTLRQRREQKS